MDMMAQMLKVLATIPESVVYKLWERWKGLVSNTELWVDFTLGLLKIAVFYLMARLIAGFIKKMIEHMISEREKRPLTMHIRRTKTMGRLLNNTILYSVNFITILLIVDLLGYSLLPLLAGAGVVGLAIGFGAQSLIKDVISGFFILFEDQFAVGDKIQIKNMTGIVEEIGLRLTKLKSEHGEIYMVPNGSIVEVTNFSIGQPVAIIDVTIQHESDVIQALHLIKESVARIMEAEKNQEQPAEVSMVKSFASKKHIIRVQWRSHQQNETLIHKLRQEIIQELELYDIPHQTEAL